MMIIWGMVPEISSLADRIFCHFGLLFTLLPPNNPEKIFLKKWKKLLEVYIIILNMSTVNENHTIQSETQCAPDRLFLSSWAIFCPFTPITAWKMKISNKKKKILEISSFNTSVPKIMIICYTAPEIWHIADIIVIFHFGLFLLFYSLSSPKNENLKTMKKNPEDNIILQKCTKNHDHMLYCSWDICCVTDVNVIFILGYFLPFYHSNSPKNQSFKKTNKKTKKKTPGDIILHICTKNYD